jgi:hypothetical protein
MYMNWDSNQAHITTFSNFQSANLRIFQKLRVYKMPRDNSFNYIPHYHNTIYKVLQALQGTSAERIWAENMYYNTNWCTPKACPFTNSLSSNNSILEIQLRPTIRPIIQKQAGRPGDRGSITGRGEIISPVASVSRPVLGPTLQWVPGTFPRG